MALVEEGYYVVEYPQVGGAAIFPIVKLREISIEGLEQ